ncbi:hypothetical protein HK102_013829 [Quaeritorhiza haematococci]|nr:hypothetical protein HK102_013829 [Quaeritorhiza haematococci]
MDAKAKENVNLTVLRRHDRTITNILDSSSHVVVYDFDTKAQKWTKKGIEGTMFLFQRSEHPMYGFLVMNRLGVDNLQVLLSDDMEFTIMQDYVIYKTLDDRVHGLWMYEVADRARLAQSLTNYCRASAAAAPTQQRAPQQQPTAPDQKPAPAVDIMALLQKAAQQGGVQATAASHQPLMHAPDMSNPNPSNFMPVSWECT